MLSSLDTVIAFAVIMTVLSLLITILVQMVSAALSLRGKNLANALSLTFQTIDPTLGEKAHSLAAQILRDPIFSDSIFGKKSRTIVAAVNKGTQLLIEAEKALKEAQHALARNRDAAKAAALADVVAKARAAVGAAKAGATVPTVKPNRTTPWGFWSLPWGGATHLGNAIRPGEIYRILHDFGALTETEAALRDIPPALVQTATKLIESLREIDQPAVESQAKLQVVARVSQLFENPLQQKAVVDSLANLGATVERATTQAYDRFQRWFGSAQDRAEQWFQTHTRMVTITMAILTAFLLQLDTVDMYRQLRAQPKLVEALVKSVPSVLEQGGTVLDPSDSPAYYTYLLWLKKHPDFSLKELPSSGDKAGYRQALANRLKTKQDPAETLPDPDTAAEWLAEYDVMLPEGTKAFQEARNATLNDLRTKLEQAGFDLVPSPLLERWKKEALPAWTKGWDPLLAHYLIHLVGVLMTAGLLALGAPFWFNLLKNLMNLRPAVAALIEKRPQSAPALTTAPAAPPSTS
jgi:hypothetical protein